MKKIYIAVAVVAVLIVGYVLGYTTRPQQATYVAGAVGDTQATPKMYQITANAASAAYVSGSVTNGSYLWATMPNGDANDRVIVSIDAFYSGLGTLSTSTASSFAVLAATSSDTTTLNSNTNIIYGAMVATSSPQAFEASSTPGLSSAAGKAYTRVWKAGSNLNFVSQGTTSAAVTLRVNYIAQ